MGMDLSGRGGDFWWKFFDWPKLLYVAIHYGWEPAGTIAPIDRHSDEPILDWDGGYFSNDFQTVTADDAWQLADALERALADIPDDADTSLEFECPADPADVPDGADLLWFRSPRQRTPIREFVQYCRKGDFEIQ